LENLKCQSMLDFVLVLDGSGSVGNAGWRSTVQFSYDLLSRVYLNYDDGATAGIVLFSKNVEIVHEMSGDRASLDTALSTMDFPASYTDTGAAIRSGMTLLASGRDGVPGVVFVVTDGKPTFRTDTDDASAEAKRLGTRLFFVTVGTNFNLEDIYRWAAKPSSQNVAYMKNYGVLESKIITLLAGLCPVLECSETTTDALQMDYIGCQTETTNGLTCQYWNTQSPHTHNYMPHLTKWTPEAGTQKMYPTLGTGDHNFCRNPAGSASGGIWCYTSSDEERWDYCSPRETPFDFLEGQVAE